MESDSCIHKSGQFFIGKFAGIKDFVHSVGIGALSLSVFIVTSVNALDANTLPSGYQTVSGNVTISRSGNTLNVNSNTAKAIVNYQEFSIGKDGVVIFDLPNSNSAILNRVVGSNSSQIYGAIQSNGNVFLINPNGILFGESASVSVNSLIASTMDIQNKDFLDGNLVFSNNGQSSSIVNKGHIQGSNVALIAAAIENSGVIEVENGNVNLAVGDSVKVHMDGGIIVDVEITESLKNKIDNFEAAISNTGTISSTGGVVRAKAELKEAFYSKLVNNEGIIKANGIVEKNGVIELVGHSEDGKGVVDNSGQILARNEDGNGGEVIISGDYVALTQDSLIDASGSNDGGLIELKAEKLKVEEGAVFKAIGEEGQNGTIVFDPVTLTVAAAGDIAPVTIVTSLGSGNVVLSASETININEEIDSSVQLNSNTLTLDDEDANNVLTVNLNADIKLGPSQTLEGDANVVNVDLDAGGDIQDGLDVVGVSNATVTATSTTDAIIYNALAYDGLFDASLTIEANDNVTVNNDITSTTNPLDLTLISDVDADGVGTVSFDIASSTSLSGGETNIYYNPGDYTIPTDFSTNVSGPLTSWMLVNSLQDLQDISTNLSGDYTLNTNIDASSTATLNGGLGFDPIGDNTTSFDGSFDGQGFTISDFNILRPSEQYVGLFGFVSTTGSVSNLTITNADIEGAAFTGVLVGRNEGSISNSHVDGIVTGYGGSGQYAGGLVGENFGTVSTSSANVNLTNAIGSGRLGGLVGRNWGGTITDSYATGNVDGGTGGYVGGLVGTNFNLQAGTPPRDGVILNSYATGEVRGNFYVGGLVGLNSVDDSFNSGTTAYIQDSYATGNVFGSSLTTGALVGISNGTNTVNPATTFNSSGSGDITVIISSLDLTQDYNLETTSSLTILTADPTNTISIGNSLGDFIITQSDIDTLSGINPLIDFNIGSNTQTGDFILADTIDFSGLGDVSLNALDFTSQLNSSGISSITLSAGSELSLLAENNVVTNQDISLVDGNISLRAGETVVVNSDITTSGGNIILNSDADANQSGATVVGADSTILTNGGNFTIGGGLDPTTGFSYGTLTNPQGVDFKGDVSTNGGSVSIKGQGYSDLGSTFRPAGVWIVDSSASGTSISTNGGNIDIIGVGGEGTSDAMGVAIFYANLSSTIGDINITGTGGQGTDGFSDGVNIQHGSTIQSVDGTININGVAGTSVNGTDRGVTTWNGATIQTTGIGDIFVSGKGSGLNFGDDIALASLTTNVFSSGGNLTIQGNTYALSSVTDFNAVGDVTLLPVLESDSIGIGSGSGSMSIDQNVLDAITSASKLIIGDVSGTGAVDIDSADFITNDNFNLEAYGGSFDISGNLNNAGSNVLLEANTGDITGNGRITADSLTLNATGNNVGVSSTDRIFTDVNNITVDSNNFYGSEDDTFTTFVFNVTDTTDLVVNDSTTANQIFDLQDFTSTNIALDNAGGSLTVSGTSVSIVGNLTLDSANDTFVNQDVSAGSVILRSDDRLYVNNDVISSGGDIILNSDRDSSGLGSITVNGANISSNGGDIILGGTTDPYNNPARGNGSSLTYDASAVRIYSSTLNAGGGDISILGEQDIPNRPYNILLESSSTIETSGDGSVNIYGEGGYASRIDILSGTTIQTENGSINITAIDATNNYNGVVGSGGSLIQATGTGDVNITGNTSLSNTGAFAGIYFNDLDVVTNSGDINLSGRDTSPYIDNQGILLENLSITSTSGDINISGAAQRGSNTIPPQLTFGLTLDNTLIATNTGNMSFTLDDPSLGAFQALTRSINVVNPSNIGDSNTTGDITFNSLNKLLDSTPTNLSIETTGDIFMRPLSETDNYLIASQTFDAIQNAKSVTIGHEGTAEGLFTLDGNVDYSTGSYDVEINSGIFDLDVETINGGSNGLTITSLIKSAFPSGIIDDTGALLKAGDITLNSSTGIGSLSNRLDIDATNLNVSSAGNVYLSEANGLTIDTISATGNLFDLELNTVGATIDLGDIDASSVFVNNVGGSLTFSGPNSTINASLNLEANDNIIVSQSIDVGNNSINLTTQIGGITQTTGTISGGSLTVDSPMDIGTSLDRLNIDVDTLNVSTVGNAYIFESNDLTVGSVSGNLFDLVLNTAARTFDLNNINTTNIAIDNAGGRLTIGGLDKTVDGFLTLASSENTDLNQNVSAEGDVTLIADNDVRIDANITTTGAGSSISTSSGRNTNIEDGHVLTLNNGDFIAKVNDENADELNRSTGNATLSIDPGAQILTNGGNVDIQSGTLSGTENGRLTMEGSTLNAGGGNINIDLTSDGSNGAVNLSNSATIETNGTGQIDITAIRTGTVNSNGGAITATGTGVTVRTEDGDINLIGDSSAATAGTRPSGIEFWGSGLHIIESTGAGNVTLNGTGGTATSFGSWGVYLRAGTEVKAVDGDIVINGTSNSGPSGNFGIHIEDFPNDINTTIQTAGLGSIEINGVANDGISTGVNIPEANIVSNNDLLVTSNTHIIQIGDGDSFTSVQGQTTLDAGGAINFSNVNNDLNETTITSGTDVVLVENGGLILEDVLVAGDMDIDVLGDVTVGTASPTTFQASNFSLHADNDITILEVIDLDINGGEFELSADNSIFVNADIKATNGTTDIVLNSDADANQLGAIAVTDSIIDSNGGDILFGGGSDPTTEYAYGTIALSHGINITNSQLNSSEGNITLNGQGVDRTGESVGELHGIIIQSDSTLTSTSGNIILDGISGIGATQNTGITLSGVNTAITSGSGVIDLRGESYANIALPVSSRSMGIRVVDSASINNADGSINLTGFGSIGGTWGGAGVQIDSGIIDNVNGDINLTGTGGVHSGIGGWQGTYTGVWLLNSSVLDVSGTGSVNIDGTGGTGVSELAGNLFQGTSITTNTGDINILGTAGTGGTTQNNGVWFFDNGLVGNNLTTSGGDINVTGIFTAGDSSGVDIKVEQGNNVFFADNGGNINFDGAVQDISNADFDTTSGNANFIADSNITVTSSSLASATGDITLEANKDSLSLGDFSGITLDDTSVDTSTGNITLFGVASSSSTTGFDGISLVNNSSISSSGTGSLVGNISLTGSGGNSGNGSQMGISLEDSSIQAVNSDILLNGTGGGLVDGGTGITNYGISLTNSIIDSTGAGVDAGNISLVGAGGESTNRSQSGIVTSFSSITSVDGDINLDGSGGVGAGQSVGVHFFQDTVIQTTGIGDNAGNIVIDGTGGSGAGNADYNNGIAVDGFIGDAERPIIQTVDGDIQLFGQGGTSVSTTGVSNHAGIQANLIIDSSGDGNILMEGQAGSDSIAGFSDRGIWGLPLQINTLTDTGTGNVTLSSERSIDLMLGSSIKSSTGDITLEANTSKTATGSFNGISLDASTITTSIGNVSLDGSSGSTGGHGITAINNSLIQSTGSSGSITLDGESLSSVAAQQKGINFNSSSIQSVNADISLNGIGAGFTNSNGNNRGNEGILLTNSTITSTGTGSNATNITLTGQGGYGNHIAHNGINLTSSTVSTVDGDIELTGTGGTTTSTRSGTQGISLSGTTLIESTGTGSEAGNITLTGYGGQGLGQFYGGIYSADASINSVDGNILLHGEGGTGSANDIFYLGLHISSLAIDSLGDGNITLEGIAGEDTILGKSALGIYTGNLLINNSSGLAGNGDVSFYSDGIQWSSLENIRGNNNLYIDTLTPGLNIAINDSTDSSPYIVPTDSLTINQLAFNSIQGGFENVIIGNTMDSRNVAISGNPDLSSSSADFYVLANNLNLDDAGDTVLTLNDASNFNFEATGDLTLNQRMEFNGGNGQTIIFIADSDGNLNGNFLDTSNSIISPGMDVVASGVNTDVTTIDTSTIDSTDNAGNVTVTATNGDVNVATRISASSFSSIGDSGNAGLININASNGSVNLNSSRVQSQSFSSAGISGNDGAIDISASNSINGLTKTSFPRLDSSVINLSARRVGTRFAPIGLNKGCVFDSAGNLLGLSNGLANGTSITDLAAQTIGGSFLNLFEIRSILLSDGLNQYFLYPSGVIPGSEVLTIPSVDLGPFQSTVFESDSSPNYFATRLSNPQLGEGNLYVGRDVVEIDQNGERELDIDGRMGNVEVHEHWNVNLLGEDRVGDISVPEVKINNSGEENILGNLLEDTNVVEEIIAEIKEERGIEFSYDDFIQELDKQYWLDDKPEQTTYLKGLTYVLQDNPEKAAIEFEKSLNINPNFMNARVALDKIAEDGII